MNIKKPSALAPALKNVFGEDGDSDEEKAVPVRDQPIDASQADTIDKLAEYVARNGLHFEESESITVLLLERDTLSLSHALSASRSHEAKEPIRSQLSIPIPA